MALFLFPASHTSQPIVDPTAAWAKLTSLALVAALAIVSSARADDNWSPQRKPTVQASQAAADNDSNSNQTNAVQANTAPTPRAEEGAHGTQLRWLPYRPHPAAAAETADNDSRPAAPVKQARFEDDDSAPPAAADWAHRPNPYRRDNRVVRAQHSTDADSDPAANPFGDAPAKPAAAPKRLPAAMPLTAASVNELPDGNAPTLPRKLPDGAPGPVRLDPVDPLQPNGKPSTNAEQPKSAPYNPGAPENATADENCSRTQKNCDTEMSAMMEKTVDKIGLDIIEKGPPGENIPCECVIPPGQFSPRSWPMLTYTWKASALCHKPLYFEEVQLERYGHSPGPYLDPIVSAAHFFVTIPLLPYYMGIDSPWECQYSLGYYRPGSCAPYMIEPFPISLRGALFEAGAVVGASYGISWGGIAN